MISLPGVLLGVPRRADMADHVVLDINEHGAGRLLLNGQDLSQAVSGVELVSRVGKATVLKLTLAAPQVSAEWNGVVAVDDETRAALLALGWSPPAVSSSRV